jgi:type II secretory pathway pseudopilin PulG
MSDVPPHSDTRHSDAWRLRGGQVGMSLVGLLVTVVILGLLMVSAIVGLKSINGGTGAGPAASAVAASNLAGRMSQTGSPNVAGIHTGPACNATADAARSANNLYFAAHGGSYPSRWSDLTASSPPLVSLPTGVKINPANPRELDGLGWKLTIAGGATSSPTFTCH